jgi:hypothetical protein
MADEELWLITGRGRELTYGSPLGSDDYRITATALSSPGRIRPGAVVHTRINADGAREIVELLSRSPYRSASTLLSREGADSIELVDLKARVVAAGGEWEQLLGGVLIVHVPRDSGIDPRAEIASMARS